MLKKIKNIAHRLTTDTKFASKTALVGVSSFAFIALVANAGVSLAPQMLQGRLVEPYSFDDKAAVAGSAAESSANFDQIKSAVLNCKAARSGGAAGSAALETFEDSFDGVVPGIGLLFVENSAQVSKNREKLIYDTMKNYAGAKFCLGSNEQVFRTIYLSNYDEALNGMDTYLRARSIEETGNDDDIEKGVFVSLAQDEIKIVTEDLRSTQKYVEDVIDRAIESAIEVDKWTESRVQTLTGKTTNQILRDIEDQNNVGNVIADTHAQLTENVRDILQAFVNGTPDKDELAKLYNFPPQQPLVEHFDATENPIEKPDDSGRNDVDSTVIQTNLDYGAPKLQNQSKLAYGLLKLVDADTAAQFQSSELPLALTFYVAAKSSRDALLPDPKTFAISPDNLVETETASETFGR